MNSLEADKISIGWYGKMPSVGDFVTRRLNTDFVSNWDNWISHGLTELREYNGSRWLDDYLSSPTWRFLLTPGFLPEPLNGETWVGILMPSVDRVGRYYPLTLALPLAAVPDSPGTRSALWAWLQSLENLAIDALEGDWSIDTLDAGLIGLGLPPCTAGGSVEITDGLSGNQWPIENANFTAMESFFAASSSPGKQLLKERACCVWYCHADTSDSRIFVTRSLDDSIAPLWCEDLHRSVSGL